MKYITLFFLFYTFSAFAKTDTTIYQVVEEMPRFAGCEDLEGTIAEKKACADKKMLEFLYKNVKYPAVSEDAVCSTFIVTFVIEKDGSISNIETLRYCDYEPIQEMLLDVVYSFPKFEPGKHKGVPVRVRFNLPMRINWQF